MLTRSHFGRLLGLCLCLGWFAAIAADKNPNSACLDCHSDKTLTKTNAAGKEVSLFVEEARLLAGIHKTNTCTSCSCTSCSYSTIC